MAKSMKTRVFRGKTLTEALVKAKSSMGPNISIVTRRDVTEATLFSKLTSGKLGGDALSVELEVAVAEPEAEAAPKESKPSAPGGHPLLKSYAKALEGMEKFGPAAKQAMAESAAPFAHVGEAATGIAGRLDEVQRELAATRRENAEFWDRVRMLVSLQARGGVPAVSPQFLECHRALAGAEVREELARDIAEKLQRDLPGESDPAVIEAALVKEVARRIPVAGPLLLGAAGGGRSGPTVVALVGASGVGKSTSVVKLAIQFSMHHGKSVGVINEDLRRPGAESQINNLGRLFGISVSTASRPEEIRDAARSMANRDLILLDTGGRSPRDAKGLARLAAIVRASGAHETHLLLSSVTAEKDMRRTVEAYAPTGFDRVILTKLDECVSPGVVVNVGADLAAGLSYVTTGPDYTRPIEPADQDFLADFVLGRREIAAFLADFVLGRREIAASSGDALEGDGA